MTSNESKAYNTHLQTIRVLRREVRRLEGDNSVLRARVARLELEAKWAADDAAGASL